MRRKLFSKDFWLVGCLAGAAFSLAVFTTISNGNLGVPYLSLLSQVIPSGDNDNTHDVGTLKHGEHDEVFAMVPHNAATHVALGGNWFDASAWSPAEVPTTSAQVLIPEDVTITYSGQADTRIKWIRVDGELTFATNAQSKLVIDTLVVDADGTLTIGTQNNPVTGSVDIVIADNGDIDTTWDTLLQSRGIISHGTVNIHGEEKLVHGKVATDPMAGATSITMKDTPTGWQVGDVIVVAGTRYIGHAWDGAKVTRFPTEDEVRTITAISGKTVSFTEPLTNNHDTPRADLKTSVANYSRTVTVRSENGAATETRHRGHVMFMHNDNIDVRYAAFDQLGRTNKALPSLEAVEFPTITPGSNVRGRYSLHIHRTGATDLSAQPAIVLGNAVFNSPGWGYVHHDSYAILHNNASYDTFGAGFVAETGNEIGTWTNNIAIDAAGICGSEPKLCVNLSTFDHGNTGDGYFFQGRLVATRNNVAASVNNGYAFFHRSYGISPTRPTGALKIPSTALLFPELTFGSSYTDSITSNRLIGPDNPPVSNFIGNESFAVATGLHIAKAGPTQNHDVYSNFENFTAWRVRDGAAFTYTGHYFIKNFDLVGDVDYVPFNPGSGVGIMFGQNSFDLTVVDPKVEGFREGIHFSKSTNLKLETGRHYTVINPTLKNISSENYPLFDPSEDKILSSADISTVPFNVTLQPLIFKDVDSAGNTHRKIEVVGTKTDGLGSVVLPIAPELLDVGFSYMIHLLSTQGYRSADDGKKYVVVEDYFTDRATHEIHKIGLVAEIDAPAAGILGNKYHYFSKAFDAGPLNLTSQPPIATGETKTARPNKLTTFNNLLSNDTDPDGDTLTLDGLVQPKHGLAYQNGTDAIVYRPDFDYEGLDSIKYWVTDNQGNYSPAYIAINVTNSNSLPEEIVIPTPTPAPETPTPPSSSRSSGGGNNNSSNSASDPTPTQIGGNDGQTDTPTTPPVRTPTTPTPKTTLPATDLFKKNLSFNQPQFNDTTDVRNLEQFLNDFEGESLTIDGTYSSADNEAIKRFQRKYKREILDVWNLTEATGYVGITTRLKMNFLLKGATAVCPAFTEYNGGLTGITNSAEVGKTQTILKDLDMYQGTINNTWDRATHLALITFQETFREVMLDPWRISAGTGYKYKTTNKFLNYFAGCDTGAVNLEGVGVYEGI